MGETYTSWKETQESPKIPRGIGFARKPGQPRGEQPWVNRGGPAQLKAGNLEAQYLADALLGKRIGIPKGSATAAPIFFHQSPDVTPQDPQGTGLYQPLIDTVGVTAGGLAQILIDTAKILMTNDIWFKSGTAFNGKMEHNITADRTWTFPDATGTVALTTGTTPVERKESHVSLFLEYPEHTC